MIRCRLVVVMLLLCVGPALAQRPLAMATPFGEHMVLQQGMSDPVWGWAEPGVEITVTLDGRSWTATANWYGSWFLRVTPPAAGGPYVMTIGDGKTIIRYQDVLVGEVWLCGGQSNMEHPVQASVFDKNVLDGINHPRMRLFRVPPTVAPEIQERVVGHWEACTPESVRLFSAAGYFFGKKLLDELNVPVGLIQSCRGASPAEAWMPRDIMWANPQYRPMPRERVDRAANWGRIQGKYMEDYQDWFYRRNDPQPPSQPASPRPLGGDLWEPAGLFNGMIAPLVPYAVRGAIWYQGEFNDLRGWQYRDLFPSLIHSWRALWGQPHFYFFFTQLANYRQPPEEPGESEWAELREAQARAQEAPETAMAVTIDIGDARDIHPADKQNVGLRLALPALNMVYGRKEIVYSGPILEAAEFKDGRATLSFRHAEKGLKTRDGGPLKGFAVAGHDRRFHWAEAKVKGDKVVVWSGAAPQPVAVRYGWADNPVCNLCNGTGLPASPFRTDDWPGLSDGLRAQNGWTEGPWADETGALR